MRRLFSDLETFSECPIKFGSHRYAEDPTTEILLWGYAIDDAPAEVWDCTSQPMPEELRQGMDAVAKGEADIVFHNGMNFDTVVLEAKGWKIPLEHIVDTMVMAYQHGLPGALADLSVIYRLDKDHAKDTDGGRLVNLFCKPLPKGRKFYRATRETHPEDWKKFVNYCRLDIEAERSLWRLLPRFNCTPAEHNLQVLDARINRRGMQMDVDLAQAAVELSADEDRRLKRRTKELTGGALDSATRTQALIDTIRNQYGVDLKNLQKSEVARLAEDERLPEPLRELLRVRLGAAKASIKKFQSVLDCVNKDGRLRGCLQFRGASRTGRWSGRLFQPQNIARPSMSDDDIRLAIACAKARDMDFFFGDRVGEALSNCLRGEIIVPPGKKLVVADYSNIEGRVLAWEAGEQWKLDAFRAYDAGTGPDLYKLTYSKAFNVPVETVTKAQRQMGKVLELAMGYGGGPGAFVTFARGYGIDLHGMAKAVLPVVPRAVLDEAVKSYEWAAAQPERLVGLERDVWIACDSVKRLWRRANSRIVEFWAETERACLMALNQKNSDWFGPRHSLRVFKKGAWLLIRLPSGRFLCYPAPVLGDDTCAFTYMGVNQYTRKWERIKTYAGKVVENITQAIAADVLANALPWLERAGYLPILTVHDEVLTEAPDDPKFCHEKLEAEMCKLPKWGRGLPLAAAGFDDYRYRK